MECSMLFLSYLFADVQSLTSNIGHISNKIYRHYCPYLQLNYFNQLIIYFEVMDVGIYKITYTGS